VVVVVLVDEPAAEQLGVGEVVEGAGEAEVVLGGFE
jgi:hypothetical protein